MASSVYFGAALILVGAAQPGPSPTDPLGPARSGQLQCYAPDTSRKVCSALAGYMWGPGSEIRNSAEVLIAPNPPIMMRTVTPVEVRSAAVCGFIRAQDIEAGTILVAGRAAPQQVAQAVRSQFLSAMAGRLNQEICTSYVPDGSTLRSQITIDGVAHPEMSQSVIWVGPNDGYVVGP